MCSGRFLKRRRRKNVFQGLPQGHRHDTGTCSLARALRPDSAFLRRLAYAGARFGPRFVIEHSPKFFGTAFALALPETRQRVLRNLRRVKGQRSFLSEQRDVVQTFTSYASCLAESLGIDRADGQTPSYRCWAASTCAPRWRSGEGRSWSRPTSALGIALPGY